MAANDWRGTLELWFELQEGKTRLMRRRHVGPLAVQRAFYPESDGSAHVYILHPPGGVAGGDQLAIDCHLAPQARAVITTPGATKFYRSEQRPSEQQVRINVAAGAVCEYLPQETIVFAGATATTKMKAELAADSIYIGWDFVSFGRPAAGERFGAGTFRQSVEIVREGEPIWFERFCATGPDAVKDQPFVLAGQPIMATLVYAGPAIESAAAKIRDTVAADAEHVFSVSQLERVVVCRYLGDQMSHAKSLFRGAWNALREGGVGKAGVAPRIWAT